MTKILLQLLAVSFSSHLHAETPANLTSFAFVNNWTQAPVRASDKALDLAIQGNGFFILQMPNRHLVFSRYGEMSLTPDGFLVQTESQGSVLGYCQGELQPINLGAFSRDENKSVAKSFRTELDGKITAQFESGYTSQTCTVALALFQDPTGLARSQHILNITESTGEAYIGLPQHDGRGSIFGSSLELLDEQIYRLNLREIDKERHAKDDWSKQKTLFYVYDLNVTHQELSEIEISAEKMGGGYQGYRRNRRKYTYSNLR